jgi:O-antigen/teichoic acid export membrane protein
MFNKIVHTLGSRLISALLSFILIILTTRFLGAEIKGEISLLILNVSMVNLLSGFSGGAALVYLTPRHSTRQLLILNTIWSFFASAAFTLVLQTLSFETGVSGFSFFALGFLESAVTTNLMLLLGKERVKAHNLIQLLKVFLTVGFLALFLGFQKSTQTFAWAFGLSQIISLFASLLVIYPYLKNESEPISISDVFKSSFRFGSLVQIGNVAQLLNYRFSYYVLELIIHPPTLALIRIGIFSTAIQLAESLWHFTRSVNTVQYAAISNLTDRKQALQISLKLVRLNYFFTAIGIAVMASIPNSWFVQLFGPDFSEVKWHFILLAPGIFALAFSGGFNHFFAGMGDHKYNTIVSLAGLVITLIISWPFIKEFETVGAAVGISIVYILQSIIQTVILMRKEGVSWRELLITMNDVREFLFQVLSKLDPKNR